MDDKAPDSSRKDESPRDDRKSSRRDRSRSRGHKSSRRDRRDRSRSRDRDRDRRRRRSRSPSPAPKPRKRSSNWDPPAEPGSAMAQQQQQVLMQQLMNQNNQGQGGKKTRELYVGNLAIGMVSEHMVREFFNTAMAGLAPEAAAQPAVVNVWMASDNKYSFVEFRTAELATTAMSLDKVELCGRSLHVGRPSGYAPAGEGGMPGMNMSMMGLGMAGSGLNLCPPLGGYFDGGPTPTKTLILENMLSVEELATDEYDDIVEDIREECGQYGTIEELVIPKPSTDGSAVPGAGKGYVKFDTPESAQKVAIG